MDTVNVELFGKDPKVQRAIATAKNLAVTKAPILIVGENGIGKKSLGRYIHLNSNRGDYPLEIIDCATDVQSVEDEILGYRNEESGRFNRGILERANKGTVIFANIDCLEENFQKKLHKILSELDDYDIDVRIISTTTKNLSKLVGAGRFYRGLYMMVATNSVYLPPLRERIGDLNEIAKYLINQKLDGRNIEIEQGVLDKMNEHYWAQNINELKTVIDGSLMDSSAERLTISDLALGDKKVINSIMDEDGDGIRLMSLQEAEKLLIKKALVHTSENRTQAAKILGVSIRTLRNKINEYRNDGSSYFVNLR